MDTGPDLRMIVDEWADRHDIAATSVCVIDADGTAHAEFGLERPAGPLVSASTCFQAASLSKPVAARVTYEAAATGLFGLDDPINDSLRSWRLRHPDGRLAASTWRQLLEHCGGTNVDGFDGYAERAPVPDLLEVVDGRSPANSERVVVNGTTSGAPEYSGGGYCVVELALTDVFGEPFASLADDLVFKPLGIDGASFVSPATFPLDGYAVARESGQPIRGNRHVYPELAAAGLWATATALATFAHRSAAEVTLGWQRVSSPTSPDALEHTGANRGMSCIVRYEPARRLAIAVMAAEHHAIPAIDELVGELR